MDSDLVTIPWLQNFRKNAYQIGTGTCEWNSKVEFLRSFWYSYTLFEKHMISTWYDWSNLKYWINLIWNKGNDTNILWEKKEGLVVLASSELFNTHYHGIDDTPTLETYHGLNVIPNANGFNYNTAIHANWSQIKKGFNNGKGGRYSYNEEKILPPSGSPSGWWYWF